MLILLIDDDPDDRIIFSEAVAEIDKGIKVITARDGFEGINLLLELVVLPDYIFLDINMPLMDGMQFLSELRKHSQFNHIPLIVYSTGLNAPDQKVLNSHAVSDFFIKPSDFFTLVHRLKSILPHSNNLQGARV